VISACSGAPFPIWRECPIPEAESSASRGILPTIDAGGLGETDFRMRRDTARARSDASQIKTKRN
jgi:hypothetical protein